MEKQNHNELWRSLLVANDPKVKRTLYHICIYVCIYIYTSIDSIKLWEMTGLHNFEA